MRRSFIMKGMRRAGTLLLIGSFLAMAFIGGCTQKPSHDELTKVEEAKAAAESAERKLADLRQERMQLENSLQQKQTELHQSEGERDDLKKKAGK
jgi:septal ring factor EnvC (AmiA/AmiB activator)